MTLPPPPEHTTANNHEPQSQSKSQPHPLVEAFFGRRKPGEATAIVPMGPMLLGHMAPRILVVNGLLLGMTAVWNPAFLLPMASGVGLGWLYFLSMIKTAQQPQPKIQFALSLLRVAVVGFFVAFLGDFDVVKSTVVIVGLLSYKWVLMVQYVRCVWAAVLLLRSSKNERPLGPRSL